MTGEATANYIHHPRVPEIIKRDLPNVKLIVMLRNPIDRAFSQFFKQVKQGREEFSFESAIEKEESRVNGETEKMFADNNYYSLNYHNYSYLTAGKYYDRLKLWFKQFPKDQIHVIKSEDFYEESNLIYNKTLEFLKLPKWELEKYQKHNYFLDKPDLKTETRQKLSEYFRPHNEKLYDLLGIDFEWN